MYVRKKLNVMYSNTSSVKKKWCKEAYENADVIIWSDNRAYYRMNYSNNTVYFVCVIPTNIDVTFYILRLSGINYSMAYYTTKINYSQT